MRPRGRLFDQFAADAPDTDPGAPPSDFAHELIRSGARLVRGTGDVLADLAAGGAR